MAVAQRPPVTIQPPRQRRAALLFGLVGPVALVAWWLVIQTVPATSALALLLVGVVVFLAGAVVDEVQGGRRVVTLDPAAGVATVRVAHLLWPQRIRRYELHQFSAVASYLSTHRVSINTLALLAPNGRDELVLATAAPVWLRQGFWKLPQLIEHPDIQQARALSAHTLQLSDLGFLGHRTSGPQVKATAG